DRPDSMIIRSAIVVLPTRSIAMMLSALASSRLVKMTCDSGSSVPTPAEDFSAFRVVFGWGVNVSVAFLSTRDRTARAQPLDQAKAQGFQASTGLRPSKRSF